MRLCAVIIIASALAILTGGRGTEASFVDTVASSANTVTATTLSAPPALEGTGGSAASLSWKPTASTFATGYRVYRATNSGGPYAVIEKVTPQTTTTYVDWPAAGTYYYFVVAYFANWESAASPTVKVTVVAAVPALVQSATGGGTVGKMSATFPSAPTANNLLVAIAATYENAALTAPAGWSTAVTGSSYPFPSQSIYYKVAGAGESSTVTVTTTATSNVTTLQVFEYSNVATTSPLDSTSSQLGVGTTITSTNATTNFEGDLIIAAASSWSGSAIGSWISPYVQQVNVTKGYPDSDSGQIVSGSAHRISGAPGSYNARATSNAGTNPDWRIQIATFKHK